MVGKGEGEGKKMIVKLDRLLKKQSIDLKHLSCKYIFAFNKG